MTLTQLSMMLNQELVVRPRQHANNYYACFDKVETKTSSIGGCLTGEYGNGRTIIEAIENYAKILSGKFIVCNAYGKNRVELQLDKITVG